MAGARRKPAGSFGWRRQPRVRLREWHSTADVDFLDAEHDGYGSLPQPVVHRRRVIFVKPSDGAQGGPAYWILVDDLSGSGRHDIDLTFQFTGADVTTRSSSVGASRRASRTVPLDFPFSLSACPASAQMWRAITHLRLDRT